MSDLGSKEIAEYRCFLSNEYRPSTIRTYAKHVENYLDWIHADRADRVPSMETMRDYLYSERIAANRGPDFKSIRAAIHLFCRQHTGKTLCLEPNRPHNLFIEAEVEAYVSHLGHVAGLTEATQRSHRSYLHQFLSYLFGQKPIEYSRISATTVLAFMSMELKHLSPASKQRVAGILRSYVRYLRFRGISLDSGLLDLPLQAPIWRLSNVPKTFSQEHLKRILASYDVGTEAGLRDFAIAVCFIELGLRASEVANLSLDDLNWREGRICVRRTKTRKERMLPLPNLVGSAIVDYLQNSRPEATVRTVFVRFSHHRGDAMGTEQIRGTLRRAYARAGIPPTITGTHILRHSKAKNMYEAGASLKSIADVLGHESIDTTKIYTKVGHSTLALVAGRWPDPKGNTDNE